MLDFFKFHSSFFLAAVHLQTTIPPRPSCDEGDGVDFFPKLYCKEFFNQRILIDDMYSMGTSS